MCTLIAEILMLIGGLYALVAGKVKLTKNLRLEGWRARVAGLILIAPLPLAFLTGLVLGALAGSAPYPKRSWTMPALSTWRWSCWRWWQSSSLAMR